MLPTSPFAARLDLTLKALSLSRGRLASELGVDKSLVGRWTNGSVRPGDHNLSRLTAFVAARIANFTMADWDRDLDDFSRLIGISPAVARMSSRDVPVQLPLVPPVIVEEARRTTAQRGTAYEGFWRTSRPSVLMQGTIFHDRGMIRLGDNGLLEVRMGGAGLFFNGWMLPAEGNLFVTLHDPVGRTPLFLVFRGVPLPKADLLDGLLLMAALDSGRTPAAVPILLERIGDLSADTEADEARLEALLAQDPVAGPGEVTETILAHLIRDIGPSVTHGNGEMFLTVPVSAKLSRGTTLTGQLRG